MFLFSSPRSLVGENCLHAADARAISLQTVLLYGMA